MTHILFKFINYLFYEKALKNGRVKSKIVRKSSLDFTFGQGSCLVSGCASPNSNKTVLVQVSLRFEIVNFNNNFVFCASCILAREIINRTNVFYPVCLKNYWEKLEKTSVTWSIL